MSALPIIRIELRNSDGSLYSDVDPLSAGGAILVVKDGQIVTLQSYLDTLEFIPGPPGPEGPPGENAIAQINYRGDWNSAETYYRNDATISPVDWHSYVCIEASTLEMPSADAEDWVLLVMHGAPGAKGDPGYSATVVVGTVSTGDAGTQAQVINVGDEYDAIFNFTIPQGIQGMQGTPGNDGLPGKNGVDGSQGIPGQAATIKVGMVTTGSAGTQASVTNVGTAQDAEFDIVIPRGEQGLQGTAGTNGTQGLQGPPGDQGIQGIPGIQGNSGVDGVAFWGWNTAGDLADISQVLGAKIGDYFVNTGTATRNILGMSVTIGGVVKSTTASTGMSAGNIRGSTGEAGAAATISVGTVITGAPGSLATVQNMGSTSAAVFAFNIPQGQQGAQGTTGQNGATGATGPAGVCPVVTTAGTGASYTATITSPAGAPTNGQLLVIIPHVVSTSATPTLALNATTARGIRRRRSNSSTGVALPATNTLTSGRPYLLQYDNAQSLWIIQDFMEAVAADITLTGLAAVATPVALTATDTVVGGMAKMRNYITRKGTGTYANGTPVGVFLRQTTEMEE